MIPSEKTQQSRTWKLTLVTLGIGVCFLDWDYPTHHPVVGHFSCQWTGFPWTQIGVIAQPSNTQCCTQASECLLNQAEYFFPLLTEVFTASPKAVIGDSRVLKLSQGYIYVPFTVADQMACHWARGALGFTAVVSPWLSFIQETWYPRFTPGTRCLPVETKISLPLLPVFDCTGFFFISLSVKFRTKLVIKYNMSETS